MLRRENRYEEVIAICKKALKYEPTDFELHYFEGISLLRLNRLKEADASLSEAIQNNKKYVRAYIALAETRCRMDDNSGLQLLEGCLKDNKGVMKST